MMFQIGFIQIGFLCHFFIGTRMTITIRLELILKISRLDIVEIQCIIHLVIGDKVLIDAWHDVAMDLAVRLERERNTCLMV